MEAQDAAHAAGSGAKPGHSPISSLWSISPASSLRELRTMGSAPANEGQGSSKTYSHRGIRHFRLNPGFRKEALDKQGSASSSCPPGYRADDPGVACTCRHWALRWPHL